MSAVGERVVVVGSVVCVVVVLCVVELPVTSVHCASSTLPPGPPQANGNFCVQVNTHVPPLHAGISNVPSGISDNLHQCNKNMNMNHKRLLMVHVGQPVVQ